MKIKPKSSNVERVADLLTAQFEAAHDAAEFRKGAVKILEDNDFLEWVKFVIQRRNETRGEWQSTKDKHIQGRSFAFRVLNEVKDQQPQYEWRTVPKVIADAYKQGWNDCLASPGMGAAEQRKWYMKGWRGHQRHMQAGGKLMDMPGRKAA